MSQVCNSALSFTDPATEALKNHQIEMGSAAFSRAFGECMFLIAAVETRETQEYSQRIESISEHLQAARVHYWRVLSLVEEAQVRPQYIEWLKSLDYDRLHKEHITATQLPDETAIWNEVVAPNKSRGDALEAYRTAFLDRFEDLVTSVEQVAKTLTAPATSYSPSLVPQAFWRLQTLFSTTMLAGQAIAVINALKPGDEDWSSIQA